jgi:AcrR family transcriptional regulator
MGVVMSRLEQKHQTRENIVASAGRNFRKLGFGGAGVDAVASDAGVTSGAFYGHFKSKGQLFEEAVLTGIEALEIGIREFQSKHKDEWWETFVKFYLGTKRTCDISDACALQNLSHELARCETGERLKFEEAFSLVAKVIVGGPKCKASPTNLEDAYMALSTLVGAVTLARAMGSDKVGEAIAKSAEKQLLAIPK